jgi:hypothetical protein
MVQLHYDCEITHFEDIILFIEFLMFIFVQAFHVLFQIGPVIFYSLLCLFVYSLKFELCLHILGISCILYLLVIVLVSMAFTCLDSAIIH